jgi:hypothetical protein
MKLPNDNCLGEMLEATRAELRRATAKVARLEAQKADLVDMVLRYLHRAETAENRLKHIHDVLRSDENTAQKP